MATGTPREGQRSRPEPTSFRVVQVTGRLLLADARKSLGKIQLIEESGLSHIVSVPMGMMNDIVRPLWDDLVTVTGIRKGKIVHLKEIVRAAQ